MNRTNYELELMNAVAQADASDVKSTLESLSADDIASTPTGGLVATDVQSAINELQSRKFEVAARSNITGARDNPEEALANLIHELEVLGLINDSTTPS